MKKIAGRLRKYLKTPKISYKEFKAWLLAVMSRNYFDKVVDSDAGDMFIHILGTMETTSFWLKRKVWSNIVADGEVERLIAEADKKHYEFLWGKEPELITATEQLEHRAEWLADLGRQVETEIKSELKHRIEHLWRTGYTTLWGEDLFEGYEDFLENLQAKQYHVFWSQARRNNQGMTQHVYYITLEPNFRHMSEWKRRKDDD